MNITDLNNKLNSINKVVDYKKLKNTLADAADLSKTLTSHDFASILPGASINGIKSLSDAIPVKDTIANLPLPQLVTLTAEMPGLRDKMVKTLTDAEKEILGQMGGPVFINPVTGITVTPKTLNATLVNGVKKANILAANAASIQSNIKSITAELPDFDGIMKDLIPLDLQGIAKGALASVANLESVAKELNTDLTKSVTSLTDIPKQLKTIAKGGVGGLASVFIADVDKALSTASISLGAAIEIDNIANLGLLQDAKLSVQNHLKESVNSVTGNLLNPLQKARVVKNLKLQKFDTAINEIQKIASLKTGIVDAAEATQKALGISQDRLETLMQSQTCDLASNISFDDVAASVSAATSYISEIGNHGVSWNGANTTASLNYAIDTTDGDYQFARVITLEELVAEFNSVKREITEVVVHWTEHFLDQPHAGAREVHEIAKDMNLDGCNYHYIIKKNGNIERGRPVEIPGQHAEDHDDFTIAVAFIGGMNSYSTQDPTTFETGPESITPIQYESLDYLLKAFYTIWPGGQAFGHNEISPEWAHDPGFSVSDYVENKFNKVNTIIPSNGSVSPDELVTAAPTTQGANAYNEFEDEEVAPPAIPPDTIGKIQEVLPDPPAPVNANPNEDATILRGDPADAHTALKNQVQKTLDTKKQLEMMAGDLEIDDAVEQVTAGVNNAIQSNDVLSLADEAVVGPAERLLEKVQIEGSDVFGRFSSISSELNASAKTFYQSTQGEVFIEETNKGLFEDLKTLEPDLTSIERALKATELRKYIDEYDSWIKVQAGEK